MFISKTDFRYNIRKENIEKNKNSLYYKMETKLLNEIHYLDVGVIMFETQNIASQTTGTA